MTTLAVPLPIVRPRLWFAGGYPCCRADGGSTSSGSGSTSTAPQTADCAACVDGLAPRYYQLEVDGVVNGDNCSDCASVFNAAFVLEFVPPGTSTFCGWVSPAFAATCPGVFGGAVSWRWEFGVTASGGDTELSLILRRISPLQTTALWKRTISGTPIDCMFADFLDLPIDSPDLTFTDLCDFSATPATAAIKAIT